MFIATDWVTCGCQTFFKFDALCTVVNYKKSLLTNNSYPDFLNADDFIEFDSYLVPESDLGNISSMNESSGTNSIAGANNNLGE